MYKIWDIGNKKKICIRSSVHSYVQKPGQEEPSAENKVKQTY